MSRPFKYTVFPWPHEFISVTFYTSQELTKEEQQQVAGAISCVPPYGPYKTLYEIALILQKKNAYLASVLRTADGQRVL